MIFIEVPSVRYSGSHWGAYCWCPVVALTFPFVWHPTSRCNSKRLYPVQYYTVLHTVYTVRVYSPSTHWALFDYELTRHHRTTPSIDGTVDRRLFKRVFRKDSLTSRKTLQFTCFLIFHLSKLSVTTLHFLQAEVFLSYVSNIAFLLWCFLVFFENLRQFLLFFSIFQYFWYISKNFKTSPANLLVVFIIRQKVANYKVTIWRSLLIAAAGANDNWSIKNFDSKCKKHLNLKSSNLPPACRMSCGTCPKSHRFERILAVHLHSASP